MPYAGVKPEKIMIGERRMKRIGIYIILTSFIITASSAWAGNADVVKVEANRTAGNRFSFSTTVAHTDDGWNHYADKWEILSPDGTVLATRTLHHPHLDEQPFTRSLSGVEILEDIDAVRVRAHCSVHGFGGREITVNLK
jgi:hypothetical protein